jgi:hypothetical protein
MRAITLQGQEEGGNYVRSGIFDAELFANDTPFQPNEAWKDSEIRMSEAAIGTRGVESVIGSRRYRVGYDTGHLLLSRPELRESDHRTGPGTEYYLG